MQKNYKNFAKPLDILIKVWYNIDVEREEVMRMSKKRKKNPAPQKRETGKEKATAFEIAKFIVDILVGLATIFSLIKWW